MALKAIIYLLGSLFAWANTFKEPIYGLAFFAFIFFVRPETIAYGQLDFIHIPLLTAVICLVATFVQKKQLGGGVNTKLTFLFLLFYLATVVSTFGSVVTPLWKWSGAYRDMFLFCFLMTRLLVDKRSIDLFILGILLGAMFLAVWGCQQYVLGNYRLEGVGGRRFGSNEFGAIMVSVLPLFVYKAKGVMPFFKEKQKQVLERIFFGVGSLSVFWAIIFTFSRGAFLGLCAAFALTWWRSANRARYLVVFVVLGMLLMPALPQNYRQRIDSIFSAKDSIVEASDLDDLNTMVSDGAITGRLAFWGAALEMTKDHPIFGVGLQNFELLTRTYLPEIGKNKDTHNTYLKVMAELGIVGITLFLGMVFVAIREIHLGRRLSLSAGNDRFLGYFGAVEAGLFGLLISGFTSSYNYTEPLYWLMFLGASLRNVAVGKPVSPIGEEFAIGLDRGAPYGLEEAS